FRNGGLVTPAIGASTTGLPTETGPIRSSLTVPFSPAARGASPWHRSRCSPCGGSPFSLRTRCRKGRAMTAKGEAPDRDGTEHRTAPGRHRGAAGALPGHRSRCSPCGWLALFTQNKVPQRASHDRQGRSTGPGRGGAPDRDGTERRTGTGRSTGRGQGGAPDRDRAERQARRGCGGSSAAGGGADERRGDRRRRGDGEDQADGGDQGAHHLLGDLSGHERVG